MSSLADLRADSDPGQEQSPERLAALSEKTPCGCGEDGKWCKGEIETHLIFLPRNSRVSARFITSSLSRLRAP